MRTALLLLTTALGFTMLLDVLYPAFTPSAAAAPPAGTCRCSSQTPCRAALCACEHEKTSVRRENKIKRRGAVAYVRLACSAKASQSSSQRHDGHDAVVFGSVATGCPTRLPLAAASDANHCSRQVACARIVHCGQLSWCAGLSGVMSSRQMQQVAPIGDAFFDGAFYHSPCRRQLQLCTQRGQR